MKAALSLLLWTLITGVQASPAQVGPEGHPERKAMKEAVGDERWQQGIRAADRLLDAYPDDLEAHYYRGVSYAALSRRPGIMRVSRRNQSEADLDFVLKRDSLFKDSVYQKALWHLYREDYRSAILLGHAQHRLRPELDEPRNGLFKIYRSFLADAPPAEVTRWIEDDSSAYGAYFKAEMLRREGRLHEADDILESLLTDPPIDVQPILLSRARIAFQRNNAAMGEDYVMQAISQLATRRQAHLLFEDFKYIITPEELASFRDLETARELQAFFHAFLARRNPLPGEAVNRRLKEHYDRLMKAEAEYAYSGLRSWHNDPDKLRELDLPETYWLNQEFNDKGLIYIRHGEPNERVFTVAGESSILSTPAGQLGAMTGIPSDRAFQSGWIPNESWRYLNPRMDFHFVIDEGAGPGNWRLAPLLTNFEMLESREHWGGVYAQLTATLRRDREERKRREITDSPVAISSLQSGGDTTGVIEQAARTPGVGTGMASRYMLDLADHRERMLDQSRTAAELGLTTDRHAWDDRIEPIDMPFTVAAFLREDNSTEVEIYYALPLGAISERIEGNLRAVALQAGYAVHDIDWNPVVDALESKRIERSDDETAAVIDFFRFSVPPDSYHVAIHAKPLNTHQLAGQVMSIRIPDLSGSELAMSDILMTYGVRPAVRESRFNRGQYYLSANPFLRYSVKQPLSFYFEIYRLARHLDGSTNFTVDYELKPQAQPRRFLGIFGRRAQPTFILTTQRSTDDSSPIEYADIDISAVEPGHYTLTITVTDNVSGANASRSREILLSD